MPEKTPIAGKRPGVRLVLKPERLLVWCTGLIALLVMIHVVLQYLLFNDGPNQLLFLANIFNVADESSIPTWFSQLLLLCSAIISASIALAFMKRSERHVWQWWVMSGVFVFLSIDEIATIHEQLITVIQRNGSSDIASISSWYIYAGILVGAVALLLIKFWWRLPPRTKWLLLGSAIVYLTGAVCMDVMGGSYVKQAFLHAGIIVAIEEGLEMMGAALFIYCLLDYTRSQELSLLVAQNALHKKNPILRKGNL